MAGTLRNIDIAADAAIGQYLDKYFYPKYTRNFVRYHDVEHQMQGIDVRFDLGGSQNMLVDEKALTHYINQDLPTFAFEIAFLRGSGELTWGWFYDGGKLTRYYLISWITARKDKNITVEDIISLDTLLISRDAVRKMLSEHGITAQSALTTAKKIIDKGQFGYFERNDGPCNFFFSNNLTEQPINIVVQKTKLVEIAKARFSIMP
jgi:hypothetical protein